MGCEVVVHGLNLLAWRQFGPFVKALGCQVMARQATKVNSGTAG